MFVNPSFLAIANDIEYAVRIPAKVKRKLQAIFREQGRMRVFTYRVFSAGIVLLIKDNLRKLNDIVIDREYMGHENFIKDMILKMLKKMRRKQHYLSRILRKTYFGSSVKIDACFCFATIYV
ncbi:hypothetical protein CL633_01765 [bacterium]|nr:hypothetical protein [bacterium]|tara:strand:- start:1900 stop:2265 length:366 start_codon:yes stop_codon:yes gene_type:complete